MTWFFIILSTGPATAQETRWSIAARPELVIGQADGEDAYLFQSIAAGRFLPDGRVVVADRGYLDIRVYGRDGIFQKRIGRHGEGPGEFSHIGGMWLTAHGKIAVWDGRNRRITILDALGNLERVNRIHENPGGGNLEVFVGTFRDDEILF